MVEAFVCFSTLDLPADHVQAAVDTRDARGHRRVRRDREVQLHRWPLRGPQLGQGGTRRQSPIIGNQASWENVVRQSDDGGLVVERPAGHRRGQLGGPSERDGAMLSHNGRIPLQSHVRRRSRERCVRSTSECRRGSQRRRVHVDVVRLCAGNLRVIEPRKRSRARVAVGGDLRRSRRRPASRASDARRARSRISGAALSSASVDPDRARETAIAASTSNRRGAARAAELRSVTGSLVRPAGRACGPEHDAVGAGAPRRCDAGAELAERSASLRLTAIKRRRRRPPHRGAPETRDRPPSSCAARGADRYVAEEEVAAVKRPAKTTPVNRRVPSLRPPWRARLYAEADLGDVERALRRRPPPSAGNVSTPRTA